MVASDRVRNLASATEFLETRLPEGGKQKRRICGFGGEENEVNSGADGSVS